MATNIPQTTTDKWNSLFPTAKELFGEACKAVAEDAWEARKPENFLISIFRYQNYVCRAPNMWVPIEGSNPPKRKPKYHPHELHRDVVDRLKTHPEFMEKFEGLMVAEPTGDIIFKPRGVEQI